ncbi:MAG: peptidyl-prolyl cis-trans isomerase, partial [Candidatus Eisenbacteria bacterium]
RSGSKRIRTLWWILTIGTVVTFIGGFIFIFGTGVHERDQAQTMPNVVGSVGGTSISQVELANATQTAVAQYQTQYGNAPAGRDLAILREQVWNNLLTERAIEAEAKRLGMTISDPEIVFAIRNTPPPDVAQNPTFQTNGRFDPQKWTQALADPSVNWSPLEDRLRRSLPGQRLEERVIAGVKISEPELQRLYDLQYEKAVATVALLPLDTAPIDSSKLNDAALNTYYEAHRADFSGPEQVQAEVVTVPRSFGPDEERIARNESEDIVKRARGGEDFAELARTFSEGPYADKGGDLGQDVPLSRLPPTLQPALASLPIGGVTDAIREGNTFFIFRLADRKVVANETLVRLSQIQKPIHPSQASMDKDAELIIKLRKEAAGGKLGAAAAAHQLPSVSTGWFAQSEYVPMFIQQPQIQAWAMTAKKGAVSRAYANEAGWVLAQVTDRREAGPRPFDAARDEVHRALELSLRQARPLATAQAIVDQVHAGQTLEAAAAQNGAAILKTAPFARTQPDPRLAVAPRAVGVAFGLPVGAVGPPIATANGVLVVRKDAEQPGSAAQFDSLRASLSQSLLSSRQRRFVTAWVQKTLATAKVEDNRQAIEDSQ